MQKTVDICKKELRGRIENIQQSSASPKIVGCGRLLHALIPHRASFWPGVLLTSYLIFTFDLYTCLTHFPHP